MSDQQKADLNLVNLSGRVWNYYTAQNQLITCGTLGITDPFVLQRFEQPDCVAMILSDPDQTPDTEITAEYETRIKPAHNMRQMPKGFSRLYEPFLRPVLNDRGFREELPNLTAKLSFVCALMKDQADMQQADLTIAHYPADSVASWHDDDTLLYGGKECVQKEDYVKIVVSSDDKGTDIALAYDGDSNTNYLVRKFASTGKGIVAFKCGAGRPRLVHRNNRNTWSGFYRFPL